MTNFTPLKIDKHKLKVYWRKYADKALPWLQGRPVTLEQVFDSHLVYRRYIDKEKTTLITIDNKKDILMWADRHTYSFHPYICSPNQEAKCWYVLDIDPQNMAFKMVKYFTDWVVDFIMEKYDKPFVAFCGYNGFHLFLELPYKDPQTVFAFSKQLSLEIAKYFYTYDPFASRFYLRLTSKEEQKQIELEFGIHHLEGSNSSMINLDTRILHRFANIRSPYSIHPRTAMVSLPVDIDEILTFSKKMAKIDNLI